jgi:hypothetical protein
VIEAIRTRIVGAPSEAVWTLLADFDGISAWADNVDHSAYLDELPPDPDREGALVGVSRRVQSGRFVLVERIIAWQPRERLAYEISGFPPVLRHVANEWRLTALPDRSTEVALVTRVDCGPRPPQRLIARLAARRLSKASDTMLDGLAAHLRQPQIPGAPS